MHPPHLMQWLATRKVEQNKAAIDPWTVVHFSAGLALGLMGVKLRSAASASIVYELVEQIFERQEWGKKFFNIHRPESLPNALTDSAVFMIGHRLGTAWNRTDHPGRA